MKKVAITGTMGSGKTECIHILRDLGYPVFSCDDAVSLMYQENHSIFPMLQKITGVKSEVKREVRRRIFKEPRFKEQVEEVIYIQLLKEIECFFEESPNTLCFVEVPLLFELSWESKFDSTILVTCAREVALQRLMDKRGLTKEEIEGRWNFQLSVEEKKMKAKFVIENNSTRELLEKRVQEVVGKLKEEDQ